MEGKGMERIKKLFFLFVILSFSIVFFAHSWVFAAYWTPIPPYNVLWPIWTGANNGIPQPAELIPTTLLTDMPVWVWNGSLPYTWFLYNTPPTAGGLLSYWDPWTGFGLWPPPSLKDPVTGAPAPIAWDFTITPFLIPSWPLSDFASWANQANLAYLAATTGAVGAVPFLNLLTPSQLWGTAPFDIPIF